MKFENNWRNKSISALEKQSYHELAHTDIPIAQRIYKAVNTPIDNLTIEDLRLLISQNTGLIYVLPLAFEHLDGNILTGGDYYPGDLFDNVISIDKTFWKDNPDLFNQMHQLINKHIDEIANEGIGLGIFSFPNL